MLDGLARLEQRPDRSYQLRTILNQLLSSRREYIELGAADHKTEVLEQAADLVLEIALDLDQQRTARQQRPDRVRSSAVREVAAVLDLSWVHSELAPYYPRLGRPSIDPVLMIYRIIPNSHDGLTPA